MSLDSNPYWNGDQHAKLQLDRVEAPWRNGSHANRAVKVANMAFCVYFHGMQEIRRNRGESHEQEMFTSLRKCAKDSGSIWSRLPGGGGGSVHSLQEAFAHLHENNGRWTDPGSARYYTKRNFCPERLSVDKSQSSTTPDVPISAVSFMEAVVEELDDNVRHFRSFLKAGKELEDVRVPSSGAGIHDSEKRDWAKTRDLVADAKTALERTRPLLWLGAQDVSTRLPVGKSRSSWERASAQVLDGFERSVKVIEVFDSVADALEIYTAEMNRPGGDRRAAAALILLNYTVSMVPVMGGFYSKLVKGIPELEDWMINVRTTRYAEIDRVISNPMYYRKADNPPRCSTCNWVTG